MRVEKTCLSGGFVARAWVCPIGRTQGVTCISKIKFVAPSYFQSPRRYTSGFKNESSNRDFSGKKKKPYEIFIWVYNISKILFRYITLSSPHQCHVNVKSRNMVNCFPYLIFKKKMVSSFLSRLKSGEGFTAFPKTTLKKFQHPAQTTHKQSFTEMQRMIHHFSKVVNDSLCIVTLLWKQQMIHRLTTYERKKRFYLPK